MKSRIKSKKLQRYSKNLKFEEVMSETLKSRSSMF
jgi:hypothetical protein